MIIKNYLDFIKENNNNTYKYGCVMLNLKFNNWDEITSIIDKKDIYTEEGDNTYGIETDPHVTLLYGLHDGVQLDDVKKIFSDIKKIDIEIEGIDIFKSNNYDVVKFNIKPTDILIDINKRLKKYPHTNDYPNYKPHVTIAYVKKGMGKKYINNNYKYSIKNCNEIEYSFANGKKEYFRI